MNTPWIADADALIEKACDLAKRGASEYLTRNNLTATPEALSICLKSSVKIKLPEAIADAKEAIDCHMHQAAQITFSLSMINAGIEAAKEASNPLRLREPDALQKASPALKG